MNIKLLYKEEVIDLTSSPFRLTKKLDLSGLTATINIKDIGSDGGKYINSRYNTRDITIEGMINTYNQSSEWVKEQKNKLYLLCNPKNEIKILFEEQGESYYINAVPVSFPLFKTDGENNNKNYQTFFLQFVCSDPLIYQDTKSVLFAQNIGSFTFPRTFNDTLMGTKLKILTKNLYYDGLIDAPIELIITINGYVLNPYLNNTSTNQKLDIKQTFNTGDQIIINTGAIKEVSLIRNGIKSNYFKYLDLSSDFIQLQAGDNVFSFGADVGVEYLEIQMNYNKRIGGF